MSESEEEVKTVVTPKLNPATQKVIEHCITDVLGEYTEETKYFTADTLHHIRSKITSKVHEILGKEEIASIDVILDLSSLEDIPFGFRIKVPKETAENHILQSVDLEESD